MTNMMNHHVSNGFLGKIFLKSLNPRSKMVIPSIISIVVNFYVGPPKTLENCWKS